MPNELSTDVLHTEYNLYPDIIQYSVKNPIIRSPYSETDLYFYQTRDTMMNNPDVFRSFVKSAESAFRASREYKAYKSYLMTDIGINRCQYLGNITSEDAEIELHHSIIGLFDICILITMHILNTIGRITTFDLVQLLIQEHYANNIPIVFLSKTIHQVITGDEDYYIGPEMVFGSWWVLLDKYKYGITYDVAYKIINYIKKYQNQMPISITVEQQEEILNFAWLSEYGMPPSECGEIPYTGEVIELEE